jgi:hypothetical protein
MFKKPLFAALILICLCFACTTIGEGEGNPYLVTRTQMNTNAVGSPFAKTALPTLTKTHITTAAPTPGETLASTATDKPATYYYFEPGVNPLTGLAVDDLEKLNRRPVMVKVSNWPREGRPHAGLSSADIVFEYFIGHQMNRFLAVYYGDDADVIGPVRSGRLVDPQLVNLYQGLLIYGDADPQVDEVIIEKLGDRALAFAEVPCPPMCGTVTHSATGVFADSGATTKYSLSIGVDNTTPDLRGMYFREEPPSGDAKGASLRVEYADFSIMEWRHDAEDGTYHLWMEAETEDGLKLKPMTDRNNDVSITFDNLIVMYADYIEYASTLHDIKIQDASGYQPALLFRDGILTYGTWRVPEPDRPIIFETPEGDSLPLKPGRTWIVIVGNSSQTMQPSGGEWEIYFALP